VELHRHHGIDEPAHHDLAILAERDPKGRDHRDALVCFDQRDLRVEEVRNASDLDVHARFAELSSSRRPRRCRRRCSRCAVAGARQRCCRWHRRAGAARRFGQPNTG
jgi:hypothetical protein